MRRIRSTSSWRRRCRSPSHCDTSTRSQRQRRCRPWCRSRCRRTCRWSWSTPSRTSDTSAITSHPVRGGRKEEENEGGERGGKEGAHTSACDTDPLCAEIEDAEEEATA